MGRWLAMVCFASFPSNCRPLNSARCGWHPCREPPVARKQRLGPDTSFVRKKERLGSDFLRSTGWIYVAAWDSPAMFCSLVHRPPPNHDQAGVLGLLEHGMTNNWDAWQTQASLLASIIGTHRRSWRRGKCECMVN